MNLAQNHMGDKVRTRIHQELIDKSCIAIPGFHPSSLPDRKLGKSII